MKKLFKTHRSAFDFDTSFCRLYVAVDAERIEEEMKEKWVKNLLKKAHNISKIKQIEQDLIIHSVHFHYNHSSVCVSI